MRLTNIRYVTITYDFEKWLPRRLHWGFGKGFWGPHKVKYTWIKDFKKKMTRYGMLLTSRPWEDDNRPPGTVTVDANKFAAVNFYGPDQPFQHPWPYQHPEYVKGSKEDPMFMTRPAHVYTKYLNLYEGIKGASHFANAIIEDEDCLPPVIKEREARVTVDSKSLEMLDRELKWSMKNDSIVQSKPKRIEFPRLNYGFLKEFGLHPLRRDFNILRSFQTVAELMIAKRYGFVDRRIVEWPAANIPFEREEQLCLLNLHTEFVTTYNSMSNLQPGSLNEMPVFDPSPEETIQKTLVDINPVHWGINFEETNFYPTSDTWKVGIHLPYKVQTIFLSNNNYNPKLQPDRFIKGRSVLFLYGWAVAQARQLYGTDDPADPVNYTDLPKPITMQCMHYNMTKNNVVFVTFQLNTLSFNSENSIKNQIWTEGPFSAETEREDIIKKLVALNLTNADQSVLQKLN